MKDRRFSCEGCRFKQDCISYNKYKVRTGCELWEREVL